MQIAAADRPWASSAAGRMSCTGGPGIAGSFATTHQGTEADATKEGRSSWSVTVGSRVGGHWPDGTSQPPTVAWDFHTHNTHGVMQQRVSRVPIPQPILLIFCKNWMALRPRAGTGRVGPNQPGVHTPSPGLEQGSRPDGLCLPDPGRGIAAPREAAPY